MGRICRADGTKGGSPRAGTDGACVSWPRFLGLEAERDVGSGAHRSEVGTPPARPRDGDVVTLSREGAPEVAAHGDLEYVVSVGRALAETMNAVIADSYTHLRAPRDVEESRMPYSA